MRRDVSHRMATIVTVLTFVAVFLTSTVAGAQTASAGAFDKLSPGEQKIARALFEAQKTSTDPKAPKPLTLDEIAAKKQGHEGWGRVFKDMKAQGLVTEKNLGQVVSSFERRHPETAKPEKAGKAEKREKPEKAEKPDKPEKPERGHRVERSERPGRPGR